MITQLTIKNIGLIDEITIDFKNNLNILTGETGAGKSILIDALRFALGDRMNSSHIRDVKIKATIEVIFEIPEKVVKKYPKFSEYLDENNELIISRTFFPDGKSRLKINGATTTLSELKEMGNHLVDFHGPHDHQLLFKEESHIEILDQLAELNNLFEPYYEKYQIFTNLLKKQKEINELSSSRERELDTLSYQIKELERVSLEEKDYQDILNEQSKLRNAEKIHEHINTAINFFENNEINISSLIQQLFSPVKSLSALDQETSSIDEKLNLLQENSDDLLNSLIYYRDSIDFNQQQAQDINSRYDIYCDILRKYGPTIQDAFDFYKKAKEKYDIMIDLEHSDKNIKEQITQTKKELIKIADKITDSRKKTAVKLKTTIEKELSELGMKQVKFQCRIEKSELNEKGQDSVVFYISPNAGEMLKPLAEIISSGEAARVMLALKKALTDVDPIPVLIFDEIDAQIGGRLGKITGLKLKDLASNHQIILITHLPQIASFADAHYKISKQVKNKRTVTVVEKLNKETKISELAQMLSGNQETNISVKHAKDLLAQTK